MVRTEPSEQEAGTGPSPGTAPRSWRAALRWLPIAAMLAVFLDSYRREWTGARDPLNQAYRDAAVGLAFAFNAWHVWTRRTALPAEPAWRIGVAAYALPAAFFLYLAWRGYGQVLGL